MLTIEIDKLQLKRLDQEIQAVGKKLNTEVRIAVRATAKKTQSSIAKQVSKKIKITQKAVREVTSVKVRTAGNYPTATIRLKETDRPSLKRFGARQIKSGVSYRIAKGGSRPKVLGAFMGPKPGKIAPKLNGHVFKRVGKRRKPIVKLHGASPWGVFKVNNLVWPTEREAKTELRKQIDRRIRQAIRKRQGKF